MSLAQRMPYQNGAGPPRALQNESDEEEEVLVNDYKEQVQFDDGMSDLDRTTSMSMAPQTDDIQLRLQAAATPLEYGASMDVKFTSYDNYCTLFHFILNSDGPVDVEPPSVS